MTKRIVQGIIIHTENTHHYGGGDYYFCPAEELDLILSVGINLIQSLLLLRGWMMESLRKKIKGWYFREVVIYFLTCCMVLNTSLPVALATPTPSGGGFTVGTGTITQDGNATNVVVGQVQSVINWTSLDTLGGTPAVRESLNFSQGSLSNSAVLNRVSGAATQFNGDLNASGMRIFIVNPAGVVFGEGSTVNVSQLVASGLGMTNTNFLNATGNPAQKMVFFSGSGDVTNNGTITATDSVYLVGEDIINNGSILCPDGLVVLAAGDILRLGQPGSSVIIDIDNDLTAYSGNDVTNNGTIGEGGSPVGELVLASGDVFSQAISNVGDLAVVAKENVELNDDIDVAGSVEVLGGQNASTTANINVHGHITAADIRLKNGADTGFDTVGEATYSPIVVDDAKNLTATDGDIVVEAVHDILIGGNVEATGNIYLNADEDGYGDPRDPGYSNYPFGGGDVIADGTITAGGKIDILGNAIRLEGDVTAISGDLNITGRTSRDLAGNTQINSGGWGVIQAADGTTLSAGQNVSITDGGGGPEDPAPSDMMTLTGEESLTIVAGAANGVDDGRIILENTTMGVVGETSLTLEQDLDLDLGDEQWDLFNQGETDLTLISNNGSVTAVETGGNPENAADQWASVGATADTGITLSGDQSNITTKQLTSATGDIDVNAKAGQLLATEAIEATAGSVILTATNGIDADGNITAGTDVHLNSDTVTADGITISAGQDVIVGDGTGDGTTLTGEGALTVEADRHIILGGPVMVNDLGGFGVKLMADLSNGDDIGDIMAYSSLTTTAGDIEGWGQNITVDGAIDSAGTLTLNAYQNITLESSADSDGAMWLKADLDDDSVGDLWATSYLDTSSGGLGATGENIQVDGTSNSGAWISMTAGNDITLGDDATSGGNMVLTADADGVDGGDMTAFGSLTSTGGSVTVLASDSTINLHDNVNAAVDILLNNNTWAADGVSLTAGQDVIVGVETDPDIYTPTTLTGEGVLAVEADRDVVLGGNVEAGGDLYLIADADGVDGGDMTAFGNLVSTGGSIEIYSSDSTTYLYGDYVEAINNILLNNNTVFGSEDDQMVDAQSGTITANGWLQKDESSLYLEAAGDISLADYVEADSGGVSIISENGKIFTDGATLENDTLDVAIRGYSDQSEGIGVDLPHGPGKAAIVIMSSEDLKLGENAELLATGLYDATVVDDRPGVDFLVDSAASDPPGRNPGEPIDVAIYLSSQTGDVHVGSAVSIESEGTGAMVVDAYDTVSFGSLFEDSLEGIGWLEVCSRRTGSLNEAVYLGTLPYADGSGPEAGYVLRGEKTDVGTGAWVLEAILPVAMPDFAQTPKGVPVEGLNVLINDDTGEFLPVTVTLDSPTSEHGGTLTLNPDGTVTYEPPTDMSGLTFDENGEATDTFTYAITDAGKVTSETTTVTITLINELPASVADVVIAEHGATVVIPVLSNDSDPDADLLSVSSFSYEGTGILILNEDGTFTYIPAEGFAGVDSFTYLATDGFNNTSETTVTITVNSAPAPGLQREVVEISGCPALVQWVASELGTDESKLQIGMANSLASDRGILPCDACANLKEAATVLQDVDGTRVAALSQIINEFASSTAPPTEEQMASIADAIANDIEGNIQYAAAGEYLDALAKYVGILNSEMGFTADESVQFATDNYVEKLADGENVGVATYVASRLAALGGS